MERRTGWETLLNRAATTKPEIYAREVAPSGKSR